MRASSFRAAFVMACVAITLLAPSHRFAAAPFGETSLRALSSLSSCRARSGHPVVAREAKPDAPLVHARFEPNLGQFPASVRFLRRGHHAMLHFLDDAVVLVSPKGSATTLRWHGARSPSAIRGEHPAGTVNRYVGAHAATWVSGAQAFDAIRYEGIYPGIDVVFYTTERGTIEFDFQVEPGADPSAIALSVDGEGTSLSIDSAGDLLIRDEGRGAAVRLRKPLAYQPSERPSGHAQPVRAAFVLSEGRVAFDLGDYDRERRLVVDPELLLASYLGGSADDQGARVAVDADGNAYVVGSTQSNDLPVVAAQDGALGGGSDLFVAKIDAATLKPVYVTYLGSSGGEVPAFTDYAYLAADAEGNVYVASTTWGTDFPTTPGAYIETVTNGYARGIVTKLSPSGEMIYSTYLASPMADQLGNSDVTIRGVAADEMGRAVVVGVTSSNTYPTTPGAFQEQRVGLPDAASDRDGFVTILDASGSAITHSTFLGGGGPGTSTWAAGVALDDKGNVYVTGTTTSPGFPVSPGAFQPFPKGGNEGFIAKLTPDLSTLVYGSYLGGKAGDDLLSIAVDAEGSAIVVGVTNNFPEPDFPTTPGAFQPQFGGSFTDAVVAKVDPSGLSLAYSSYLGGGADEYATAVAVDAQGSAYVAGGIAGIEFGAFPITDDAFQPERGGDIDAWVARVEPDGSALGTSSFLGGEARDVAQGIAVDAKGFVWMTGLTLSLELPTVSAFQPSLTGGDEAFVARISPFPSSSPTPQPSGSIALKPNKGGDTGLVTVLVAGTNTFELQENATVRLEGASEVKPFATRWRGGGVLQATFDLRGAPLGPRDVVVENPDGTSATLAKGFEVEEGVEPQIWTDVLGYSALRGGKQQAYQVLVGNRGNVDAVGVPVYVAFPKYLAWELGVPLVEPEGVDGLDPGEVPIHYEVGDEIVVPVLVPVVPADSPGRAIPFLFTAPDDPEYAHLQFDFRTWGGKPLLALGDTPLESGPLSHPLGGTRGAGPGGALLPTPCLLKGAEWLLDCVGIFIPGEACVVGFTEKLAKNALSLANAFWGLEPGKDVGQALDNTEAWLRDALIDLATVCLPVAGQVVSAFKCGNGIDDVAKKCQDPVKRTPRTIVVSNDPNEKGGSAGHATAHCVSGEEPLRYVILFENKPDASAPAQKVVVTDRLDADALDLDTVAFGPVTVGRRTFDVTSVGDGFHAEIDLAPEQPLLLRIDGALDRSTSTLTWTLEAVDPATGQPPEDPLAGFLPPNEVAPEGQGSVVFTVRANESLASGATLENQARIVFDTNDPIDTNVFPNTIDRAYPVLAAMSDIRADAEDEEQTAAIVSYELPAATDDCPEPVTVTCDPPPGSRFAVGTTTVECLATDVSGNRTPGSFRVTVDRPEGCGCSVAPSAAPEWLELAAAVTLVAVARRRRKGTAQGTPRCTARVVWRAVCNARRSTCAVRGGREKRLAEEEEARPGEEVEERQDGGGRRDLHVESMTTRAGRVRRKVLDSTIQHFKKNRRRMRYHRLRQQGLVISSGLIEGTVRHLVGMRLDGPGMRWGKARADAVLPLRCIGCRAL